MKQYQISFKTEKDSADSFRELRKKIHPGSEDRMLFQIFSESMDRDAADRIAGELEKEFLESAMWDALPAGILSVAICVLTRIRLS